jgi:hypothetical protein
VNKNNVGDSITNNRTINNVINPMNDKPCSILITIKYIHISISKVIFQNHTICFIRFLKVSSTEYDVSKFIKNSIGFS